MGCGINGKGNGELSAVSEDNYKRRLADLQIGSAGGRNKGDDGQSAVSYQQAD